jgi:molybdopterin-guanine dinucleotide biosynthesis protein A
LTDRNTENRREAYILAGGESRRFGTDKALFPLEGRPLILHVIETLEPLFHSLTIVSSRGEKLGFTGREVIPDRIEGIGPLGGIHAAMTHCRSERFFAVACDLPGLNRDLVRYMLELQGEHDVILPLVNNQWEPLHAVYGRQCLHAVEHCISLGKRRVFDFFDSCRLREVGEDEIRPFGDPKRIFRNINFREDLEAFQ